MLYYSGNLLWGYEQIGRHDILEALRFLACDTSVQPHVEWLGSFWRHAVVSSLPIPDLKLQILAWQHHFASLFGDSALQRVKGFVPPGMHLPNHPATLFAFVSALRECGYCWLIVQENSVEKLDLSALIQGQEMIPHLPIGAQFQCGGGLNPGVDQDPGFRYEACRADATLCAGPGGWADRRSAAGWFTPSSPRSPMESMAA